MIPVSGCRNEMALIPLAGKSSFTFVHVDDVDFSPFTPHSCYTFARAFTMPIAIPSLAPNVLRCGAIGLGRMGQRHAWNVRWS